MSGEGLYIAPAHAGAAVEQVEPASVEAVSGAVAEWVDQVGRFLGLLQVAIEQSSPRPDASAEVRALAAQLPALIRQCRAQVPTPEMIRTWVKSVSEVPAGAVVAADA